MADQDQGKGSQRLAQFKKGVDHAEARRSRSETTIQIRKQNKDEMLAKRRQMVSKDASGAETGAIFHTSAFTGNTDVPSSGTARMMSEATRQQIAEHRANIFTDDPMKQYIQAVIKADIFPKLIEMLSTTEFDIQKEAAWAISNATSGGTNEQILYLVHSNVIPPICSLLHVSDVKVVTVALEGLENMLKAANQLGQLDRVVEIISDCGGAQAIEDLQTHENKIVYNRALKLLETYLGAEEEDEDDALAGGFFNPPAAPGAQGGFGMPPAPPSAGGFNAFGAPPAGGGFKY
eukprot:gene4679-3355_t